MVTAAEGGRRRKRGGDAGLAVKPLSQAAQRRTYIDPATTGPQQSRRPVRIVTSIKCTVANTKQYTGADIMK